MLTKKRKMELINHAIQKLNKIIVLTSPLKDYYLGTSRTLPNNKSRDNHCSHSALEAEGLRKLED